MSDVDLSYLPSSDTESTSSSSARSSDDKEERNVNARQTSEQRARTPEREDRVDNTMCLKCKKNKIEFVTDSCRCPVFCRTCAMKFASGGYCLVCGEFYRSFKHV